MNNVNCDQLNCIGNVDGRCYAGSCKGAIIRITNRRRTPEQAKRFYELACAVFEDYFGDDYQDDDLEE